MTKLKTLKNLPSRKELEKDGWKDAFIEGVLAERGVIRAEAIKWVKYIERDEPPETPRPEVRGITERRW